MKNVKYIVRMLAIAGLALGINGMAAHAQGKIRIAAIGAANYNYVDAGLQKFVQLPGAPGFSSADYSQASGLALSGGLGGEYLFNDQFGAVLNVLYDARYVQKEVAGAKFRPDLGYVSIEPGVRFNLGMPELSLTAGGTIAVKAFSKYNYTPGQTDEVAREIKSADLNNVRDVAYGAWLGIGYDFRLNDTRQNIGWYLTPFAQGSYLFDQKKQDVVTDEDPMWNTLSVRVGVQVKMQF